MPFVPCCGRVSGALIGNFVLTLAFIFNAGSFTLSAESTIIANMCYHAQLSNHLYDVMSSFIL